MKKKREIPQENTIRKPEKQSAKQSTGKHHGIWHIFAAALAISLTLGTVVLLFLAFPKIKATFAETGDTDSKTVWSADQATASGEDASSETGSGSMTTPGWEKIDPEKEAARESANAEPTATEAETEIQQDLKDENGRLLQRYVQTAGTVQNTGSEGDAGEVTLLFAGDILFDDSYAGMHALRGRTGGIYDCFSQSLLQEMQDADIFMLNNEFPYTDRGTPTPNKTYTFRGKTENAKMLLDLGADLVSLANNHTYDYGQQGFEDTLTTLNAIEIPYVGAGTNLEDAQKPVYFVTESAETIGFVSATQIERLDHPDTVGATEETGGTLRCWTDSEFGHLLDSITEAKENSDFVVAYIHWGTESTSEVDWAQLKQVEAIAAAGVDLIVGDHPHVLQKLDKISGVPVIYSMGNYWFNSKTCDTGLLKVILSDHTIKTIQFLPAQQKGCFTAMLEGTEKERVLQDMRNMSPNVSIDGDGYVSFR